VANSQNLPAEIREPETIDRDERRQRDFERLNKNPGFTVYPAFAKSAIVKSLLSPASLLIFFCYYR
jgi:hypothetical protein